jgi:hemerythrin
VADLATHASALAGIEAMNDQHGIVVDSLSAIDQQLARGKSASRLVKQMVRLAEFTNLHFGCEESLLRRHGFPGLEEHCRAHRDLMSLLKHAVDRAECGDDAELSRALVSARCRYLDHVEQLDRDYSQWLKTRGVY